MEEEYWGSYSSQQESKGAWWQGLCHGGSANVSGRDKEYCVTYENSYDTIKRNYV